MTYTLDQMLNKHVGEKGSPERQEFDASLEAKLTVKYCKDGTVVSDFEAYHKAVGLCKYFNDTRQPILIKTASYSYVEAFRYCVFTELISKSDVIFITECIPEFWQTDIIGLPY